MYKELVMGTDLPHQRLFAPINGVEVAFEHCTWENLPFLYFAGMSNNLKKRLDLKYPCSN